MPLKWSTVARSWAAGRPAFAARSSIVEGFFVSDGFRKVSLSTVSNDAQSEPVTNHLRFVSSSKIDQYVAPFWCMRTGHPNFALVRAARKRLPSAFTQIDHSL